MTLNKTMTLTVKKDMNQVRNDFGMTYDDKNRQVYVFGGYDGSYLDHVERYSVDKNEWTVLSPMNTDKGNVSACIINNQYIFIIGGYNNNVTYLNEIEKYSI